MQNLTHNTHSNAGIAASPALQSTNYWSCTLLKKVFLFLEVLKLDFYGYLSVKLCLFHMFLIPFRIKSV